MHLTASGTNSGQGRTARLLVLLPMTFSLAACAGSGVGDLAGLGESDAAKSGLSASTTVNQMPLTELQKATTYWGMAFAKSPRNPEAALNYARNLKAMGDKRRALAVLQKSSIFNGKSLPLISEYGRLALELGQTSLAEKLLARADHPSKPDWRVISARGTVYARQGRHKEAISFFERASILVPNKPSVLNNLAMAYTMDARPEKAEILLRKAALSKGPQAARIRQNLSLVLGLQGKYDEAKTVAARQISETAANANVDTIRKMVKLEPKLSPEAEATRIIALAEASQDAFAVTSQPKTAATRPAKTKTRQVALRPSR